MGRRVFLGIALALVLIWPRGASAQQVVTFASGGSTAAGQTHTDILTITIPQNTQALLIGAAVFATQNVTSVTCGGQLLSEHYDHNGNVPQHEIWYLLNPPAGEVKCSATTGANVNVCMAGLGLVGVDLEETPFGAVTATDSGGSATNSITVTVPTTSGDFVLGFLAKRFEDSDGEGGIPTSPQNLIVYGRATSGNNDPVCAWASTTASGESTGIQFSWVNNRPNSAGGFVVNAGPLPFARRLYFVQ